MLKNIVTSLFLLAIVFGAVPMHPVHAATTITLADLEAGDLVRGQSFSAVYYYGRDGFRYVFPNEKTYSTWYSNFDTVKWLTDADLGKIQIGGNVTYKPGSKMVKINTDPKVYYVGAGGDLYWVADQATAESLFGSDWNTKIDDVPDGFFSNYTQTDDEVDAQIVAMTTPDSSTTINTDRGLTDFITITIDSNAYSDTEVSINPGDVVRFVNNDSTKHTATADDLSWGSGTISPDGGFWQRRFEDAGAFTYFCSYHPDMTGAIIVE
ncbi:MAG: hypothetical protein AAB865_00240 [Patescibacteria group bacterium]